MSANAATQLSGAEASGAASHHSSEGNGPHSFGGQVSPRAARSQISTAVSFEGARAAGSAAVPSRSLEEESALSAAEGDAEYSHSAEPNPVAPAHSRPSRSRLPRPSNSLISTAVQPASPRNHLQQQPVSPRLNRANSVVSHTAPGSRHHGRAGTPASAYGQTQSFLPPSRARHLSPAGQIGAEQGDGTQPGFHLQQQQQQPAWQHMPPVFPPLHEYGVVPAAHQPGSLPQQAQLHQQQISLPRTEQRDSFDGHHRSSDNGGGRRLGANGLGSAGEQTGTLTAAHAAAAAGVPEAFAGVPGLMAAAHAGALSPAGLAAAPAGSSSVAPVAPSSAGLVGPPAMHVAHRQQQHLQQQNQLPPQLPMLQHPPTPYTLLQPPELQGVQHGYAASSQAAMPGASAAPSNVHNQGAGGSLHPVPVGAMAAAAAAGVENAGHGIQGPTAALPAGLLQQLQAQVTPALLAMLQQQQQPAQGHGTGQQAPGVQPGQLVYNQQQLQNALGLLLASLASQATEQYGIVFPATAAAMVNGAAADAQPASLAGMHPANVDMPPPVPAQHAKSCDSSIQGARPGGHGSRGASVEAFGTPDAVAAAAEAAAGQLAAIGSAGHNGQPLTGQQGLQQPGMPQAAAGALPSPATAAATPATLQQQQQRQQHVQQPQYAQWRSPSPSPAPAAHAAARTSTAGEGHGSVVNMGGSGQGGFGSLLPSQHAGEAGGAAVSSAGGASRAGGGFASEEGEAEADVPTPYVCEGGSSGPGAAAAAAVDAAAVAGNADIEAAGRSTGEAAGETGMEGLPVCGDCHPDQPQQQHASGSPQLHGGVAAHQAAAAELQHGCHRSAQQHERHVQQRVQVQPPVQLGHLQGDDVQQVQGGDYVHPAASVHATMVSEGNGSESGSHADSEISSTHSGNSNSNRGGAGGNVAHDGTGAEVVSQPCGASHSAASPQPSASAPAAATATGPLSRGTAVSGAAGESRDGPVGGNAGRLVNGGFHAAAEADAGPAAVHYVQQQVQQPAMSRQRSNQHEAPLQTQQPQQPQQGVQHPRDSSLAMATAGPAGTRSATISTNSGTVDMSIHNDSHRSGAGSQAEAPAADGQEWTGNGYDEYAAGATNSRDGEARGDPPGAFDIAESGRAPDAEYAEASGQHQVYQHQHIHHIQHQQQADEQQENGVLPAGVPAPDFVAAVAQHAGVSVGNTYGHLHGQLEQSVGNAAVDQQNLHVQVPVGAATAPGDDGYVVGSPFLQGAYSSSNVAGLNVASEHAAAAAAGVERGRSSSAAGNVPDGAAAAGMSTAGEVDASSWQQGQQTALETQAAAGQALHVDPLAENEQLGQVHHAHRPAAAEQVEQSPLCAAFSITSQLQPPQLQQHHQTHAMVQQSHTVPMPDAVPQVTEIHGHFSNSQVPATAAAAQMEAAAAAAAASQRQAHGHPQLHASDVQPQDTEMHGTLGASAGTAAEAQLAAAAAAAAVGHGHHVHHAPRHWPGAPVGAGAGTAGSTGAIGDGRLPPLPHAHGSRVHCSHHRLQSGAASRTGPAAQAAAGMNHLASPPAAGLGSTGALCAAAGVASSSHTVPPKSVSAEAPNPNAVVHSRAHHSPPAVNFNPLPAAVALLHRQHGSAPAANSDSGVGALPIASVPEQEQQQLQPAIAAAANGVSGVFAGADAQQHDEPPCSPSHADGDNSQMGQQDGSRGSPPAGMGRVGSVPPPEHFDELFEAQQHQDVVDQPDAAAASAPTMSEGAGSHHRVAEHVRQQRSQHEQEADGPSHAAQAYMQQTVDSKSAVTSPAQQRRRQPAGYSAQAAAAAAGDSSHGNHGPQPVQQLQQHWQHLQGVFQEGAGQVGGRASSMRFSCGQPEGSMQAGVSSKVYGSVSAGFADGSKAEGSLSYGAGMDNGSIGNAFSRAGAYGRAAAHHRRQRSVQQQHGEAAAEVETGANCAASQGGAEQVSQQQLPQQSEQHTDRQQTQSHSTRRPRSAAGAAHAADVAAATLEGEGSHGSRSQETRSCKRRRRTSCEAASVQQRIASSMQTTEA